MGKASRPADLTEEFIAGCRAVFLISENIPQQMKTGLLGDVLWEVFLSGAWLRGRLHELGCPEAKIINITFAHGQMCAGSDPWYIAEVVLEQYHKGLAPQAGADLADRLLNGEPIPVYKVTDDEGGPPEDSTE